MIHYRETQVELEFGTGDICIAGGGFIGASGENIGIATFSPQEPREIGSEGDIKANLPHKIGSFPVIMTFIKPESIDVVIEQLQQAKEFMLKEVEKC